MPACGEGFSRSESAGLPFLSCQIVPGNAVTCRVVRRTGILGAAWYRPLPGRTGTSEQTCVPLRHESPATVSSISGGGEAEPRWLRLGMVLCARRPAQTLKYGGQRGVAYQKAAARGARRSWPEGAWRRCRGRLGAAHRLRCSSCGRAYRGRAGRRRGGVSKRCSRRTWPGGPGCPRPARPARLS